MNKNPLQLILGGIFPLSITRANLQSTLFGIIGIILSGIFSSWAQVILLSSLSVSIAILNGPSFRKAFPGLFDIGPFLSRKIAADVVSSTNPGEALQSWISGPYHVWGVATLLGMQQAVDYVVGSNPYMTFSGAPIPEVPVPDQTPRSAVPATAATKPPVVTPSPVVSPSPVSQSQVPQGDDFNGMEIDL